MMLDLDKPITTRDGRKVRLIYTSSKAKCGLLVVLIERPDGYEDLRSYTLEGKGYRGAGLYDISYSDELINERVKVKRWKVTFNDGVTHFGRDHLFYMNSTAAIRAHILVHNDALELANYVKSIELVDVYEDELRDDE